MKLLIRSATIIDPRSEYHLQKQDILVENGVLRIGSGALADGTEVLEGDNLYVSPGWFDMRVNFYDPGHEYREGLANGCLTSAYGGFTGVALLPETNPSISTKGQLEYVKNRTAGFITDVFPMATLLQENGEVISEMYDLKNAGAIAFSSGYKSISDEGLLLRAMQYSTTLGLPLILTPVNKSIYGKGVMHEGVMNVQLGMKGIPSIADELEIYKFVTLCKYTGAKIHITGLSCCEEIMIINAGKAEGLDITTSTSGHHLCFDDNDLQDFNTNLKLRPPLRSRHDKVSLRECLLDGAIDCVASDHNPLEEDMKRCEFELAAYGASGTQTLFSQLIEAFSEDKLSEIINAIAIRPREVLGLQVPLIKNGEAANLTIFDPTKEWVLDEITNKSRSRNSPYWKKILHGKAIAIVNKSMVKKLD